MGLLDILEGSDHRLRGNVGGSGGVSSIAISGEYVLLPVVV